MVLDETSNGRNLTVAPGEGFEIALGEIRTAGYGWVVEDAGEPMLELTQERFYSPQRPVQVSGTHAWCFRARSSGQARVRLAYRRPWVGDAPQSVFQLEVAVRVAEHAAP